MHMRKIEKNADDRPALLLLSGTHALPPSAIIVTLIVIKSYSRDADKKQGAAVMPPPA
jgi:hypothetical protein